MKTLIIVFLLALALLCYSGAKRSAANRSEAVYAAWCKAYDKKISYGEWLTLYDAHLLPNQDAKAALDAANAAAAMAGAAMGFSAVK